MVELLAEGLNGSVSQVHAHSLHTWKEQLGLIHLTGELCINLLEKRKGHQSLEEILES